MPSYGSPRNTPLAAALVACVLAILAIVAVTSPPAHYDRALILSFVIVHAAELYLGRVHAYAMAAAAGAGHLGLVAAAIARGAPLAWSSELASLALFAVVAALFVEQSARRRRRLDRLVLLFERAEEGDLSDEYDVAADRRPDAVTAVGRAYNRLRARLESLVLSDPLTGCLNRRGFDRALVREIARSARNGSELALLAIDLDHFKQLNDRHGHLAGDVILRELGALLQNGVRAGDVVARTGGEEFTLILPDTDPAGGYQLGVRLRDRVRDRSFEIDGKALRVTVSIGVASAAGPTVGDAGTELKLRADQALYAAKRLGRDRVLTWNE